MPEPISREPEGKPCPTVKVKSDHPEHVGGYIIINAADFDASRHERFIDPSPSEIPPPPPL